MLGSARMTLLMITVVAAGALTGCATARTEIQLTCPHLPQYTAEEMAEALNLLTDERFRALRGAAVVKKFVDDWGEHRARCRSINKPLR